MTTSIGARLVADILDRNAVQQIIDHCRTVENMSTMTVDEATSFEFAADNLQEILEMQTKQET